MNWAVIWGIVASIVAVLGGVAWLGLYSQIKSLIADLVAVYSDYEEAVAAGVVTDAERIEIADALIDAIGQATSIAQVVINLIEKIKAILRAAYAKKSKSDKYTYTKKIKK